ncbi:MAG: hypothetical protein ACI857_000296 [Arenicella sp.]|jgi:hypothetical protein
MSSTDVFNAIGDGMYWLFQSTLEPMSDGDLVWKLVMWFGFIAFGFWMYKQYKFNKEAEANPNQLK